MLERSASTRLARLVRLAATAAFVVTGSLVAATAAADDVSDCFTLDDDGCPVQRINCPLIQPPTITAVNGLLDTEISVVQREERCVPIVSGASGIPTEENVTWGTMTLRNYATPVTPGGSLTGPTLRLDKTRLVDPSQSYDPVSNPIATTGDRFRVLLRNSLPNSSFPAGSCEPAYYSVCSDNPTQVCSCTDPDGACVASDATTWTCDKNDSSRSCRLAEISQTAPNCFHGPEVTNLHYHGSHVSPQPHQDFVLLKLFSENQVEPPPPEPGDDPTIAVGTYQTDIPQFPWNQPPGTHWYHPHKHGSTAVQLVNGMAGALIIQGELDDFLWDRYGLGTDPTQEQIDRFEKVMVIQQIAEENGFFHPGSKPTGFPPYPLVNGQLIPTIEMRYGEVQRWRFVSATTNGSVQSMLSFSSTDFPGFQVRQVAQDGVQFHPLNYERQPIGNSVAGYEISPGNRVDLMVRAPDPPADGQSMTFYVTRRVIGSLDPTVDAIITRQNRRAQELVELDGESATGPLVRVHVSGVQQPAQYLPPVWPDMPPYLADLTKQSTRWVSFSMTTNDNSRSTQGTPQTRFFVDGLQYQDECAGETVSLNTTQEWRVTNTSAPQHPFHIHTNPFQLTYRRWSTDGGGAPIPVQTQSFDPPYPWFDTIALKPGNPQRQSHTRLLYRPEDYTGLLVLHCHFLGHEDRGMMTNVQILCPTSNPSSGPVGFGTPSLIGEGDNCLQPPAEISPLLACPSTFSESTEESHGARHGE